MSARPGQAVQGVREHQMGGPDLAPEHREPVHAALEASAALGKGARTLNVQVEDLLPRRRLHRFFPRRRARVPSSIRLSSVSKSAARLRAPTDLGTLQIKERRPRIHILCRVPRNRSSTTNSSRSTQRGPTIQWGWRRSWSEAGGLRSLTTGPSSIASRQCGRMAASLPCSGRASRGF